MNEVLRGMGMEEIVPGEVVVRVVSCGELSEVEAVLRGWGGVTWGTLT
ncbi:MAG: hypothetical protein OXH66_02995 [Gemmatimonadetes bacterium]|nr:hypothetical protein [Gemmatimonadota bacterium]